MLDNVRPASQQGSGNAPRKAPQRRERRGHPRALIALPVRIRQLAPPGNSLEITYTLDVSRNGLLFKSRRNFHLHATVWVTLPYHPDSPYPGWEFPASVVRVRRLEAGEAQVALRSHSARSDSAKSSTA